jgi:hypothetical protein
LVEREREERERERGEREREERERGGRERTLFEFILLCINVTIACYTSI